MRLVSQRTRKDCGVACVAMIAGVSYTRARQLVYGGGPDEGTDAEDLRSALRTVDIDLAPRAVSLFGRDVGVLRRDALVKANRLARGNWHWIVWDAKRGLVLDPRQPPYKRLRPYAYISVVGQS